MSKKILKLAAVCLLCAACLPLGGCGVRIDEDALNAQADYSIDIALPYATVTPEPMQQEQAQALVIDSEGGVTVNDSTTILQGEARANTGESSNYNSLRLGNTGLAVQALQTRLQELGYYDAGVSGVFDANTEAAVRRFEQTYGTMQTGVATVDLQTRLFAQDALTYGSEAYNNAVIAQYKVLQRGDVGSSVYALQQRLKNLNYPITDLTGIFDNETANAVMLFYEAYGLTASDVASVALQRELYSDTARTYGDAAAQAASAADPLTIMSEESVAEIQRRLIELGYLSGEATGEQDAATQLAVKLFNEACGQLPSGALSADILSLLQSEDAPRFETLASRYSNLIEGSSGDEVMRLQQRLVDLGYATGSPNGTYGTATSASIRLFQTANGMEADGVASAYLQAVLYSSFALNINGETAGAPTPEPTAEPEATPEATPEAEEIPIEPVPDEASAEPEASGEAEATETPAPTDTPAPTEEPAPYEELSLGSTGEAVKRLQERLSELGYTTNPSGSFDGLTQMSVMSFQVNLGRNPDGVVTSDLQTVLYSKVAPFSYITLYGEIQNFRKLKLGDTGDDVTLLQRRLWQLGFLKQEDVESSVGTYDEATKEAVAAFQTKFEFEVVDGIATAELQCSLHSALFDQQQ